MSEGSQKASGKPAAVNKLDEALEEHVRPYLDLIDSLRSHGIEEETPLPQICCVGDQSCGKSSVLEALSGVSFPRGSGLVTRCPVQLVMKKSAPGSSWKAHARVAWQKSTQPKGAGEVRSPELLEAVIADLMTAVCDATTNGFSTDSLVIDISSPECPDLTLIDLPGIVRTAVAGQTVGVITEVNALIDSYLRQERTIILAIVPANQDVATVDILERAAAVDPTGSRTIGVLTKPDLIDPGGESEVAAVLQNKRKPLRLGYAMVRNRTQKELASGMSLTAAHAAEAQFFANHPVFGSLSGKESLFGVEALTRRCVGLLVTRIQAALPSIKWELQQALVQVESDLRPLARDLPKYTTSSSSSSSSSTGGSTAAAGRAHADRLRLMLRVTGDFCRLLRASVRGEYRDPLLNSTPELRVRSRVDAAFRALQAGVASMDPGFEQPDFPRLLQEELRAHRGRELTGMVNSQFFFIFMLQQVERFRPLVEHCRAECCAAVLSVGRELAAAVTPRYPGLTRCLADVVDDVVMDIGESLLPELDGVFEKERNPFTENQDLVEAINRVRFERFDRVLQQVLLEAGDGVPPSGESLLSRKTGGTGASAAAAGGSPLDPLQEWITLNLGQWYRYSHGATPTSKVEDMSTILQAYWRVTSKRVCDNACMLLESTFLAEVVNATEALLLTRAQSLDAGGLAAALQEDAATARRRDTLEQRQTRIAAALAKIVELAPDVVAVGRPDSAQTAPIRPSAAATNGAAGVVSSSSSSSSSNAAVGVEVAPLSEPEKRALEAKDGSLAHLLYKSDGDNEGLVYWLGTARHTRRFENPHEKGYLTMSSSGMAAGTEATLVSRRRVPCATAAAPESWLCMDVGRHCSLAPTHISLCNGSSEPGSDLLNWVLEGYDDSIRMWVIIKRVTGPRALGSPHGAATWQLEVSTASSSNSGSGSGSGSSRVKSYRFLRLRSTGSNGKAGLGLPVCAVELYGKLFAQTEL